MKKRNTKALTTWVGIDLHALQMTVAFWLDLPFAPERDRHRD